MHNKIALYITPYEGPKSYNDMIDIAVENGIKNIEPVASYEFRNPGKCNNYSSFFLSF